MRPADPQGFLVLPENRLAVAAVKRLGPRGKHVATRLVTLFGPSGCGKSHLARELVRSWIDQPVTGKLLTVTASQFAAEFAEASVHKTISRFQSRYRQHVRLLIVEDLQGLARKTESQQQLTAAIDDILRRGGNVLFTANRLPGGIPGLSRRLVNRLHGGVCVEVKPLRVDSRIKLLDHLLAGDSLRLTAGQVEEIAQSGLATPRELQGLLSQLRNAESQEGRTGRTSPQVLAAALGERARHPGWTLADLTARCAEQFQVSVDELRGPRRTQTVSLARQSAMYFAREILHLSYLEIGSYFGRDNHSTVIHACRKIQEILRSDSEAQRQIQQLQDKLLERTAPQ